MIVDKIIFPKTLGEDIVIIRHVLEYGSYNLEPVLYEWFTIQLERILYEFLRYVSFVLSIKYHRS